MGDAIQKLFDTMDDLRQKADVSAAFSEPVVVEGRTLISVAKVGYGFGLGFGTSNEEEEAEENSGGGVGGGAYAQPLGVIEVTQEGIRVEPVVDEQKVTMAGVLLAGWFIFWIARTLTQIFGKD